MPHGMLLALIVAVVFVNGWTDAPNAIACAVSTGAMGYRRAAAMAAVCNLAGIVVMQLVSTSVADTVSSLVDFGGDGARALTAIGAAMLAIVLFAVGAWRFGIPTSESHALIAAMTGAALALGSGGGINAAAWRKVLWGLGLSLAMGFALGFALTKLLRGWLQRRRARALDRFQVLAAAGMAFMHGAQDGQKFIAVFLVVERMLTGQAALPGWRVPLLCALTMALGTSVGGGRIVEMVGGRMTRLRKDEGVCADLGGAVCLLLASLCGVPMSTSHTKTTAMMGAGTAGGRGVDLRAAGGIVATWIVTFPVCGVIGWGVAKVLLGVWG